MHYVFDTEFNLRLAYGGEMPALVDDVLAVRVLQRDAKSTNESLFARERKLLPGLFRDSLTRAERLRVPLWRAVDYRSWL
jgi:hypothetical protein